MTVNCATCGNTVAVGTSFCTHCGALAAPPVRAFCTSCGLELQPGARFCPGCGAVAAAVAPSPTQPGPTRAPSRQGRGLGMIFAALAGVLILAGVVVGGFLLVGTPQPAPQQAPAASAPTAQPGVQAGGRSPAAPAGPSPAVPAQPSPTVEPPIVFGKAAIREPDPAKLVKTAAWGEVPVNQVGIVLKDGQTRQDAEKVAADLGGTIVGEVEFISFYQIETRGTTEADLKAALDKAAAQASVEGALPNMQAYSRDIPCTPGSPLEDPFYADDNGRANEIIGTERAWAIIRASGVKLSNVQVGVLDEAVGSKSPELNGRSQIVPLEPLDSNADVGEADNHGTRVSQVIAADPDNGGMAGVASALGDKLKVTVRNRYTNQPRFTETVPDPADPTKVIRRNGKAYVYADFVHIMKQIEGGATIINMSFGPEMGDGNREVNYLWRKFMAKVGQKHPQVLFVAAAANEPKDNDGRNDWPAGIKLPNVITVAGLDNNGQRANFSARATGDGEVTISAPAVGVVVGQDPLARTPETANGTSFATPQVAAAAAMLRSINPKLTAAEIKQYLTASAQSGTRPHGQGPATPIPPGMGAGVLSVDGAVLAVVNDLRKPQPPLKLDDLVKLATIEGSAAPKGPVAFGVTAKIGAVPAQGTDVKAELHGGGATVSGAPSRRLTSPGDVTWEVTLTAQDAKPKLRLIRLDSGGFCEVALAPVDLNGKWAGSLILENVEVSSDITIPDPFDATKPPTVITKEQCEAQYKEQMGKASPIILEITAPNPQAGTVSFVSGSNASQAVPYRFDGPRFLVDMNQQGMKMHMEGALAIGKTEYTLSGPLSTVLESDGKVVLRLTSTFSVAKPVPAAG